MEYIVNSINLLYTTEVEGLEVTTYLLAKVNYDYYGNDPEISVKLQPVLKKTYDSDGNIIGLKKYDILYKSYNDLLESIKPQIELKIKSDSYQLDGSKYLRSVLNELKSLS